VYFRNIQSPVVVAFSRSMAQFSLSGSIIRMYTALTSVPLVIIFSLFTFAPPQYMLKRYPDTDTRWTIRLAGVSGLGYQFLRLYAARHADDLTGHSRAALDIARHTCGGMAIGFLIAMLLSHFFRKRKI
jgi:hypothetical protein